jgi:hypothetical protein
MRYLLLLNNSTEEARSWESLTAEEAAKVRAEEIPKWGEFMAWMAERGIQSEGLELGGPWNVKTVRVRDGEALITDGPYAETKEQIGGYFLVELENLDQAIELASRIPIVHKGSVEIRPLIEN